MGQPYIVVGDKTSGGGVVLTGAPTTVINGKPMARVGDRATCQKHRGIFSIKTGDPDWDIDGQAAARNGDKLDCGCVLIASQNLSHDEESDVGSNPANTLPADTAAAASAIASVAPDICLDCLKKAAASGASMIVRG